MKRTARALPPHDKNISNMSIQATTTKQVVLEVGYKEVGYCDLDLNVSAVNVPNAKQPSAEVPNVGSTTQVILEVEAKDIPYCDLELNVTAKEVPCTVKIADEAVQPRLHPSAVKLGVDIPTTRRRSRPLAAARRRCMRLPGWRRFVCSIC